MSTLRAKAERRQTSASQVYARLRDDILVGEILPGEKLAVEAVSGRLGVGVTPVREALNRLSSEGLVELKDLRGFYATDLDEPALRDLFDSRALLDSLLLRRAIERGDDSWEERVIVAQHRLSKTPWSTERDRFALDPAHARAQHAFHGALISACGSRWLIAASNQLNLIASRYLWLVMKSKFEEDRPPRMTRQIAEAAVGRDGDEAVRLLCALYSGVAATILRSLDEI